MLVFSVGGDYELVGSKRSAAPSTFVEIENATGFEGEVRITREHPTTVLPGTDRILVQPPPKSASADIGDQTSLTDVLDQVVATPVREWKAVCSGQLTGQGFNLNDEFWGEKSEVVPDEGARPARRDALQRIAFATWRPLHGGCKDERLFHRYSSLRRRAGSSWRAVPENTVTYIWQRVS